MSEEVFLLGKSNSNRMRPWLEAFGQDFKQHENLRICENGNKNMSDVLYISDFTLFEICMAFTGSIFLMLTYCLLLLTDVECEEVTAREGCKKLNRIALIKVILHSILSVILFSTGHYWVMLMSIPMVVWLANELHSVPRSHRGVYDPFEISDLGIIDRHLKRCEAEMLYTLLFFFYYLYRFIGAHIDIKIPLPEEHTDHLFDEF